jgi:extracellular elastinolytic metalloproteinase
MSEPLASSSLPFDIRFPEQRAQLPPDANSSGLEDTGAVTLRSAPGVRVTRVRWVPPAGLAPMTGSYTQRATDLLSQLGTTAGLEAGPAPDVRVDPQVVATSSGAHVVHGRQMLHGVPIFQATQLVIFAPDDTVSTVAGDAVMVPEGSANLGSQVAPSDALQAALRFLAALPAEGTDAYGQPYSPTSDRRLRQAIHRTRHLFDIARRFRRGPDGIPRVIAQFEDHADLPTVLDKGELGAATLASLVWLAANDAIALCWQLVITPDLERQYRVLVDAANGTVTYCASTTHDVAARGTVFRTDPRQQAELLPFPVAASTYSLPTPPGLPAGFPRDWVSVDATEGTLADAFKAGDQAPLRGKLGADAITFTEANTSSLDQYVLNAFYFTCVMHDVLYTLGFREEDGNFQQDNFGQPGAASDRVRVSVSPGAVWATASMTTPADGVSPLLNLGIATETGRHTALDASVVFHEATHGMTLRLVGGGLDTHSLAAPQSAGMNEGWSDFVSCQLLQSEVVGAWLVNKSGGIRSRPYDAAYPGTYASLGKAGYVEVHGVGEVWCATLMDLARALGRTVILRLLVDSLKLTPASPSFLDGRDALLLALDHERAAGLIGAGEYSDRVRSMRQVFGARGMGPASSSDGALLRGIIADFGANTSDGPPSSATWSDWSLAGPGGTVPPLAAVACTANGRATSLYVVGGDGSVYESTSPDYSAPWSGWQRAGPAGSIPASAGLAASTGSGTTLWAVGSDGGLYSASRASAAGSWTAWSRTGPAGTIPPLARITANSLAGRNGVAVYVVGGDGFLYGSTLPSAGGVWTPWTRLNAAGPVRSASALAVADLGDSTAAFVLGADGLAYSARRRGDGPWGAWVRDGPGGTVPIDAAITACVRNDGRVQLFCVGGDGRIYRTVRGASVTP